MKAIEEIKRSILIKRIVYTMIHILFFACIIYLFWFNYLLGYLAFIIWLCNVYQYYRKWIKIPFKNEIIAVCLKQIRPNLIYHYETKGKEILEIIKKYKLFSEDAYFSFSDYIKDTVEGISYTSVDLSVFLTSPKIKKHRILEFKGKVYILSAKKYPCDYILTEYGSKIDAEGFTKLDLESIEMNERFDLYTNNPLEIFKVFNPKRIEAWRKLHFCEDSRSIISHIGESLYIFLSNGENQFENFNDLEEIKKEYIQQLENLQKYLEIF
ncbi:MAG: DUF3137 domain-containing protein [Anaeroplasmataceae bacterium]|nr:DUF3137 domain-containing protein [Anaeroplasmataceae bacterium]